jgi:catechol 2,3-dioxygenase-like lactoylglutathione lyase family enzyme
MKLITRFGDIFQVSYVTRDRDRAVAFAADKLGIDNFFSFDGRCPVLARGATEELNLRVAVANTGAHQFEIIEPVSGPTWIYTEGFDLGRQLLTLHHIGVAVMGPFTVWQETIAKLRADGDEIVQISEPAAGEEPMACFAYADNRRTLGHFTEYLWWAPAMNGMPTMPSMQQR